MQSLEAHSEYEYQICPHLKITEQWMTKNGCCARVIFLRIPLFLNSLKELLAAGDKECMRPTCKAVNEIQWMHWIAEFLPSGVLHADCLPTHGTLGASLAPVR